MNETDQKILERPELDRWDASVGTKLLTSRMT